MPNFRTVRKNDYDFHSPSLMGGYNYHFAPRLATFDFHNFHDFYDFQAKARASERGLDKKDAFFYLKIIYYIKIMLKYGKIIVK